MSLLTVTYLESALTDPRLIILGLCTFLLCLANAKTPVQSSALWLEDIKKSVNKTIGLWLYPFRAKDTIRAAYIQAKGKPVQVLATESLITFVASPQHIRDIANAANDQLSLHAAAKRILKPEYTMAGFNWHEQRGVDGIGFVRALRTLLTNHLPNLTSGARDLVDRTFAEEFAKGSTAVNAAEFVKELCTKFTAFSFFGPEILEDEVFMDAALYYNRDVMLGSEVLRFLPVFLHPSVGKILPVFLRRQQTFYYGLTQLFQKRLDNPSTEKKDDVIQWIIETSPKSKPWTTGRMAFEIMAIWFGSVEGLSATLLYTIYNLATHPEYIAPLREEVESPAIEEFYRTGDGLPLMDSFFKESTRWTPVDSVSTRRHALKDFIFHDGTHVKKGEWICLPIGAMLRDPSMFPQPDVFDGFRFVDPQSIGRERSEQPEGPSKFTDTSDTWQVWGSGKILCPGRFYVSFAMKHAMVHILKNYDPEMVDKKGNPTMSWRTWNLPRPGVKVNFKARA